MLQIISFLVACIPAVLSQTWVVNTEYGAVRGHWSEHYNVWRFDGMPYAAPPLGALRFKAPVPPNPWSGILDAVNDTVTCHQTLNSASATDTEACLVINVYVPESALNRGPLPVLFFIHGGGLEVGNGNGYDPFLTTRHDVILITFNYRLGAFGYTCLGNERIPGNAGFKDIIFALRWTKRNIVNFGGDPEAVTIYGESASGYQAHALVLTEATEGLFQRAIIESGAALCFMGHDYDRLGKAKAIALDLGFPHADDLEKLGQFLENANVADLIQSSAKFRIRNMCVERPIDGIENAVPEIYNMVIKSGNYRKIPILFAFTELEFLTFSRGFSSIIDHLNNKFENFLPVDLSFPTKEEKDEIIQRIRDLYFGGESIITENSFRGYVEYQSDAAFVVGIYRSIMQHALNSDSPLYLLEFSYLGGFNQPSTSPEFNVASHADIVAHVLSLGHSNNETIARDQIVRDRMTEMWTNFVKFGDPTPPGSLLGVHWPVFTATEGSYMNVGEQLTVRRGLHPDRLQFWTEIYDRYFYPPPVFENSGNKRDFSFNLVLGCTTMLLFRMIYVTI